MDIFGEFNFTNSVNYVASLVEVLVPDGGEMRTMIDDDWEE